MKTKYIIISLSTILFVILAVLLLLPGKEITIESIKEMTYEYYDENDKGVEYTIKCDDSCVATIKSNESSKDKVTKVYSLLVYTPII